jgi:hypothetical protein
MKKAIEQCKQISLHTELNETLVCKYEYYEDGVWGLDRKVGFITGIAAGIPIRSLLICGYQQSMALPPIPLKTVLIDVISSMSTSVWNAWETWQGAYTSIAFNGKHNSPELEASIGFCDLILTLVLSHHHLVRLTPTEITISSISLLSLT